MGIQTAAVLYPVNSTTLYSAAGIDVRLLDAAQAGADDDTQTATATHTQDGQGRMFDPGSTTSANRSALVLQEEGWALRLTDDMTPADDTNCNAMLRSGTLTFNVTVAVNQAGGTYTGGTYGPNWSVSLWRYNPATNTGTGIALGTNNATTWNYTPVTGDLGTFKTIAISIAIAANVEFAAGEILLAEIGLGVGTIPNPTVGTATWTFTLRVDHANTNCTFAAGQGIRQLCTLALDATTVCTSDRTSMTVQETLEATTVCTADQAKITSALVTLDASTVCTASDTHTASLSGAGEGLEATTVCTPDGRIDLDLGDVPTEGGGETTIIFAVLD